jgi:hypothetical protein
MAALHRHGRTASLRLRLLWWHVLLDLGLSLLLPDLI